MDKLFYEQLCLQEEKYSKLLDAIKLLKETLLENPEVNKTSEASEPKTSVYKQPDIFKQTSEFLNMAVDRKVLYALKEIGTGNINGVLKSWINLEEDIDENFARRKVKQWLNALAYKGEIEVVAKGAGKRSGVYRYKGNDDDLS